jgi:hypothetical protein
MAIAKALIEKKGKKKRKERGLPRNFIVTKGFIL